MSEAKHLTRAPLRLVGGVQKLRETSDRALRWRSADSLLGHMMHDATLVFRGTLYHHEN